MLNPGDMVRLKRGYDGDFVADAGATARVTATGIYIASHGWPGSEAKAYIRLEWERDGKDNGQSNGLYVQDDFAKVYGMNKYKKMR